MSLKKTFGVHASSCKPMKICAMKMKVELEEKNNAGVKRVFDGREEFIRHLWKGHAMDINEFQVNDS